MEIKECRYCILDTISFAFFPHFLLFVFFFPPRAWIGLHAMQEQLAGGKRERDRERETLRP